MTLLLGILFLKALLGAQPLTVVTMSMDPAELSHSLREGSPTMPPGDCKALDLVECQLGVSRRVSDISLRWVQLDDDPELEAVLITEAHAENTYAAYVFDEQGGKWNLVGSFFCQQWTCDGNSLIRIQRLTEDSPPLVLCYRDLGGSGVVNLTTQAFQLRRGRLWPVFEIANYVNFPFESPYIEEHLVLASKNRLVIHAIIRRPGKSVTNACEVRRWNSASNTFIAAKSDQAKYCNPKSGKPIPGESLWTGLPLHP